MANVKVLRLKANKVPVVEFRPPGVPEGTEFKVLIEGD